MRYIGWEERMIKPLAKRFFGSEIPQKEKPFDIYVFDDPEIDDREERDFVTVRPHGDDYGVWKKINGDLEKNQKGTILLTIGINKNCWCKVDKDLKGLAGKIGIGEDELKMILKDGH
jgi:hypothetical protein